MSKQLEVIDPALAAWMERQHVFFVATAPSGDNGHVNCSPKGGDSFRVLGSNQVAYLDYVGSGAETVAHLRENGRIVVMFCAFDGKPNIVRMHGKGTVYAQEDPGFDELAEFFPNHPGSRSIIKIDVERISNSCGYAVPLMEFKAEREALTKWAIHKGPEALAEYRRENNSFSIDGLPAFKALLLD